MQDDALENGWEYPANQGVSYDDMRLVEASVPYVPSAGEHFIRLVYETLTSSWVQEKDENVDYELNGLKRVTRPFVARPNTAYTNVVGTANYDSDGTTVYLSDYEIVKTDAMWSLVEIWIERGVLSKSEGQGPSDIPNSKQHTWEAFGEEPVSMPGIIISKLKSDILGYTTYRYTSISNLSDGDPTVGTLSTYEENIDVKKPGFVEIKSVTPAILPLGSGGKIAYIKTTPPTVGKLTASVTVTITTSPTADTAVAYNLEGVAVSATILNIRITPLGEASGGTPISSASTSVDQQALHHYTKASPSTEYLQSSFITGGVEIGGVQQTAYNNKEITLEGSGPVTTTGIYDSNVTPIFVGLDGVQYYRKTNYTLS